jgi:dTDP-glucose 4,6-dehydratase
MNYTKRILVTGGLGFIGSNYLNKYVPLHQNYLFVNLDCVTYAANPKNITLKNKPNYLFEKADIRDIEHLNDIILKYKISDIIHFAAETHVDVSIENPSIFMETNVVGTHNLLLLAKNIR